MKKLLVLLGVALALGGGSWLATRKAAPPEIQVERARRETLVSLLKAAARYRPMPVPACVEVLRIEPGDALGVWRNAYAWDRECVRAWIERGRRDAERALEGAGKPDITN